MGCDFQMCLFLLVRKQSLLEKRKICVKICHKIIFHLSQKKFFCMKMKYFYDRCSIYMLCPSDQKDKECLSSCHQARWNWRMFFELKMSIMYGKHNYCIIKWLGALPISLHWNYDSFIINMNSEKPPKRFYQSSDLSISIKKFFILSNKYNLYLTWSL